MKPEEESEYSPAFYEISLSGGRPWGFSLTGGSEHHCPLTIAKVENGGKAHQGGLEKDDTLLSINEEECLSHALAVSLIHNAGDNITLIVQRGTLDNNTMKMEDLYHQDIPEESDKVSLSKQEYIQWESEKGLEKSKGDSGGSGVVNRRIKKQNSLSNPQRPKSWHNTGMVPSYLSNMDGGSEVHDSGSPTVDAYTSELQQRSKEQFHLLSGTNLPPSVHDVSPGFVKRRAMNYDNPVNNFQNPNQGYDLQPAIIYPQVVTAVQVQNTQAGRMPNGNVSPSQQMPGMGIANYSMVQMPQKQYASTADVQGEKKVPPPLPTRVDSKNRAQQLSEHHAKSSSWPKTTPQATSTDTTTQTSGISHHSLPPVKLSPSQEEVYPPPRKSPGYHPRQARVPPTDFKLFTAQPVAISEENSTTIPEDWLHTPDPLPSPKSWPASFNCSPPSPPTRDIDGERSYEKRGKRHETSDSLYKDYEACLKEFLKHEETIQDSVQEPTETAPSPATYENQRLSETAPTRTSPSYLSQKGSQAWDARVQRKNSLNGESNKRTWKNPHDFSATAPAPLRPDPYHHNSNTEYAIKDTESDKTTSISKPAVAPHRVKQQTESDLPGNAPGNRTPINLALAAVDLEGELAAESRKGLSDRNFESPAVNADMVGGTSKPLPLEDQRKLNQMLNENSLLSMLQRDNEKMSFFGDEEFDMKNGPEVANDQADPVVSPSGGYHHRQRSYDSPSTVAYGLKQRQHLYYSSIGHSHSTTSLNSTTPEPNVQDKSHSNHSKYHSFSGASDFEIPDVSMQKKLPFQQSLRPQQSAVSKKEDLRHSMTDLSGPTEKSAHRRQKISDPQVESVITSQRPQRRSEQLDSRRNGKQRGQRSSQSSQSGSSTSWSSHDSISGDRYSSTSSLNSSRGYGEHRQGSHGRFSDVGIKQSESGQWTSSPVDLAHPKVSHLPRSASMSGPTHTGSHLSSSSFDSYGKPHYTVSRLPDEYSGTPNDGRKRNKQRKVPERSQSIAMMDHRRKAFTSPKSDMNGVPFGASFTGVGGSDKVQGPIRANLSLNSSAVSKYPVEPGLTRQENFQTDGSTVRVSMRMPLSETKETQRETSNAADLSPPDELMSPPLPPPPEEVQEIPADVEFPPPPPEFLLENDLHRERVPFDPKDREVIPVQRVEAVQVNPSSYVVKVQSPITTTVSSEEDLLNRSNVPIRDKNDPQEPDNRSLDNREADEDSGTEKSSLEDREENPSKEDTTEVVEVNESDDPLVNRVLTFISTSQTSQLRKLYPDPRKRGRKQSRLATSKMPNVSSEEKEKYPSRKDSLSPHEGPLSMSLTSYLQISPGRASLLNKARSLQGSDVACEDEDAEKMRSTKEELIERITKKVEELCNTQQEVRQEMADTEEIGRHLDSTINQSCPVEVQKKYSTYIGDLEKVTKLLLTLSRKLTRVDNILHDLSEDNKENRENLEKMRSNYAGRYEDAKNLKQSISQRHGDISSRLKETLSAEEHEDFSYFVGVRCRLLIEAQDIEDKIQLGNEQIQALKASLEESEKTSKNGEATEEASKDVNGNCNDGHSKPFPS